ncbi:MAG: glutamine-hydrolyzing carbamoyl-phosphate synthase small subunit [Candidatus Omnitrophica bacterium]|nr:glutamine-hydrolyzing carbamoyl-phosphate synthase small subunit [Candidatus Omnitrophota bacterium]MBU4488828.1 glutamine-hydrolyzing carbamoyl-phosphate synthase small subunit [Candidatus Omnitrophota bacterium]
MENKKKAKIALEDGTVFEGTSFGVSGEKDGEAVFNTSMTGYQEVITDPSYKGQIVIMTYPLIGNYGVNDEDAESRKPFLEAFVVKELSKIASNWRSKKSLDQYLKENGILGIEGIDTRALTKHIRLKGAMKAVVSTEEMDDKRLLNKAKASPGLVGRDLVKEVIEPDTRYWNKDGKYKVVVIDCGAKFNILRELAKRDCLVTIVPANATAGNILKLKPDGVLLSNGPGDPAAVKYLISTVKDLLGKIPMFGICLGQQILGLAMGGKTYKLKFGHHGANHPVKDLKTGAISITSQNHGFSVDMDSLSSDEVEVTHINLNDNTPEGMRHKRFPVFSVQFHPEASPGPHDAGYLFDEFIAMMKGKDA